MRASQNEEDGDVDCGIDGSGGESGYQGRDRGIWVIGGTAGTGHDGGPIESLSLLNGGLGKNSRVDRVHGVGVVDWNLYLFHGSR